MPATRPQKDSPCPLFVLKTQGYWYFSKNSEKNALRLAGGRASELPYEQNRFIIVCSGVVA